MLRTQNQHYHRETPYDLEMCNDATTAKKLCRITIC